MCKRELAICRTEVRRGTCSFRRKYPVSLAHPDQNPLILANSHLLVGQVRLHDYCDSQSPGYSMEVFAQGFGVPQSNSWAIFMLYGLRAFQRRRPEIQNAHCKDAKAQGSKLFRLLF